jgi:hypothetical protein
MWSTGQEQYRTIIDIKPVNCCAIRRESSMKARSTVSGKGLVGLIVLKTILNYIRFS